MPDPSTEPRVRLVVVTGSGRSGTSTVAGTLKRLGLHVPQPEHPADETNPRGFYEPQWVVDFHKRLLGSIPVRTNDARPRAAEYVRKAAAAPEFHDELRTWLAEQVAIVGPGGQLAVKDPRTFWMHELWGAVAEDLGIDLSYLTMLRHPAEVVQSRESHYHAEQTDEFRRTRQTADLAGWVNSAFETEVATRGRPRVFVRYVDLLADWRATMLQVQARLDLTYNADLSTSDPHDVDDFIDVDLRRSRVDWDDVDTLPDLRDQASLAWDALNALVEAPYDPDSIRTLSTVHERYSVLHHFAEAIALDHTNVSVVQERRRVRDRMGAEQHKLRARLRRQRQDLKSLQARLAQVERPTRRRLLHLPWKR